MADGGNGPGLVTVFGGPGFIGRYAIRALAKSGWRVRAASRRPDLAGHLQPMGGVGQILPVQANLRYPETLARAVQGADAVVNSVGILMPSGKQTFEAIHTDGVRAMARAAREAGVKRFVHVSAIGADPKSKAVYAQTKAAGEAAVLEEFPSAVILRPSIVFGAEDQFFNRFAEMARMSPFLPLIDGGWTQFQPVFVGDVATAIAAAVEGHATPGTIYELGGPEVLKFRELLDRVQTYTDRKRFYLRLTPGIAKLQALLMSPLPNALRPITLDQVRLLAKDNVVSDAAIKDGRTIQALGVAAPTSVAAVVPGYLERFKPKGQYAHYRG
jgi:uncharacterized protein YbjT (DUF2867 family)